MKFEDMINQVIQGDCLEVMKSIPDKSVDLVLTDPPYGMSYQSSWRIEKHEKIEGDSDLSWFPSFASQVYRVLKDNTHIYIFCNEYCIGFFREQLEKVGFTNKRMLVWVKNNHTSGDLLGDYANKTEYILFAHKGRRELMGGRDTNVLELKRVSQSDDHPTQKPVSTATRLISKSSNEDDLILDPFLGSGTTAVACQNLKRNFIGVEISEKYCEIARQRLRQQVLI